MGIPPIHPDYTGSEAKFLTWLRIVDKMITEDPSISFVLSPRVPLGDGTISIQINVAQNGAIIWYTRFYFHFHPGASSADTDNPNASKGHFKPSDGGKMRAYEDNVKFNPHLIQLWRTARDAARKK